MSKDRKQDTPEKSKVLSMADKYKKKQQNLSNGAFVILVIVVVAFVAWPILSHPGGGGSLVFGAYKGKEIVYSQEYGLFKAQLENSMRYISSDSPLYQVRSAFENAFFATVSNMGMYRKLEKEGTSISDQEVNALLVQQFTSPETGLDRASLQALSGNELANAQEIMRYAAASEVWNDIYMQSTLFSNEMLSLIVPSLGDMRKISYLYFQVEDFPDSALEAYYEKNKKLFRTESLQRITVNSNGDANKVKAELEKPNANFAELAKQYSVDVFSLQGGKAGSSSYHELLSTFENGAADTSPVSEWADKVFSLSPGSFAGPYEINSQWVFYQLDAEAEPADDSFEAMKKDVQDYIKAKDLSQITSYFEEELKQLRSEASATPQQSLAQIAAGSSTGVRSGESDYFGFNYNEGSSTMLFPRLAESFKESALASAANKSKDFYQTVFSMEAGSLSYPLLIGEDYVMLIRLENTRKSNINDFVQDSSSNLLNRANYLGEAVEMYGDQLEFLNSRNLRNSFERAFSNYASAYTSN